MQKRTTPLRTEPLMPLFATLNEMIALSSATTHYRRWLARTPESAAENQDTIKLLDRFQKRLAQLPPSQEGGLHYVTTK